MSKAPWMAVKGSTENAKLGPYVAATVTEASTCPDSCALKVEIKPDGTKKKGPCYGHFGPIAIHWRNIGEHTAGMSWDDALKVVRRFRKGTLGRFGQVGDHPGEDGWLDRPAMQAWTNSTQGQTWWGYCHYDVTSLTPMAAHNIFVIREANAAGYAVNVSCETMTQVDRAIKLGLSPVVVVPSDTRATQVTPDGHKVIMCPATVRDDVTCGGSPTTMACGGGVPLCTRTNRTWAIGFPGHGARKKSVDALVKKMALFRHVGVPVPATSAPIYSKIIQIEP